MHISVPTKVFLDVVLCSEAMLAVKRLLPLQIACQVIVVSKVEALGKVLLDLLDNLSDLIAIKLHVLRSSTEPGITGSRAIFCLLFDCLSWSIAT